MYDSVISFLAIIDGGKYSRTDYNDEVDDMFIDGNPSDARTLRWIAQNSSA
jgi:hypothetical protein